ncbi:MAG TPA: hypothetical protein VI409_13000 [Gaiellaceae bacterium]|nr:hypothetical protein [Gaiellaceae bacterium]
MSSDLERRIREARAALPEPDAEATRRAHARALGAVRHRRPRVRLAVLAGVALALALALGAGLGTLIAPSGTAARGPVGLGFLPEPGWYVLQSGARATSSAPATAMAANVGFAADDAVRGLADSSGLPYATLLALPPRGIVITATFTPLGEPWVDAIIEEGKLPLRVRDAVADTGYGGQVRPEEPLGVYQLRALVNGYNIDVHVYFGSLRPSSSLREEAQRQLDQLVVRSGRTSGNAGARVEGAAAKASAPVIDRTVVCTMSFIGGAHEIEVRAQKGFRSGGSSWDRPPLAALTTGSAGSAAKALDNMLGWVTAGRPSPTATVIPVRFPDVTYPIATWGTLAMSRTQCRPAATRFPLTAKGLTGGPAGALGETFDCGAPRRVLVRMRAVLESPASLREHRQFLDTKTPIREGYVVVGTQTGKPLVYAEVFASGKANLFVARGCMPD